MSFLAGFSPSFLSPLGVCVIAGVFVKYIRDVKTLRKLDAVRAAKYSMKWIL